MKIYTRTGDDGSTGLLGGVRVRKDSVRIEAYGTVDELNAAIGLVRATRSDDDVDAALGRVQGELFALGAELATASDSKATSRSAPIGDEHITALELEIDVWESELAPLRSFILPGGAARSAALHLARTICRRAERRTLELARAEPVSTTALRYLNRLSDHLFVAARVANLRAGESDVPWLPRSVGS